MGLYLILKHFVVNFKKYISIFLVINIFLFTTFTKSVAEENVFTINNVKVEGPIDLNFSRNKYFNKAFSNSFKTLMNRILLTRDFKKISDVKPKEIKYLISSFQLLDESYKGDIYKISIKVLFNEKKIKQLLRKKNISFSQPDNISVVFFPILNSNNEIQSFYGNYFYKNWNQIKFNDELVNFILPLEDLEDISKIIKMKNNIEKLNVEDLVNKYDIKNYAFVYMDHEVNKLNVYIKLNFNDNKISKNITYNLKSLNNEEELSVILKKLKLTIIDIWKEENLINLLMPLSIKIKFGQTNIDELEKLKQSFNKISIIESHDLVEFNINSSIFKIYYYGNPKKLRSALLKFGYKLKNDQGFWQLNK